MAERWRSSAARALALTVAASLLAGCAAVSNAGTRPPADTSPSAQLAQLVVAAPGPMSGYSRAQFGDGWRVVSGECDTREAVLRRDGTSVSTDRYCRPASGRWRSPYDGLSVTDPHLLQIDHVVPLAEAWRSGARGWPAAQRADFANDLAHPELLAVSATTNTAKGDRGPATWKPPNRATWCMYARDWIAVKVAWRLTTDASEKTALGQLLNTCPSGGGRAR